MVVALEVEQVEAEVAAEEEVEVPLDHTSWLDLASFCKNLLHGPLYQFLVAIEHQNYLSSQMVDIGSSFDALWDSRMQSRHKRAQDDPASSRKGRLRDMEVVVVREEDLAR